MRLSASFIGAADGGAAGVGVAAGADCVRAATGPAGADCVRGAGGTGGADCAKAAGGEPNAAPAKPIVAAAKAPRNRRSLRTPRPGQSGVHSRAQTMGALARLDRLNSAPTASGSPSLRFSFTKSDFHRMQPDSWRVRGLSPCRAV